MSCKTSLQGHNNNTPALYTTPHSHTPLPFVTPFPYTPSSYTPSSYTPSPFPYAHSLYTPFPYTPYTPLLFYPFPIHPIPFHTTLLPRALNDINNSLTLYNFFKSFLSYLPLDLYHYYL